MKHGRKSERVFRRLGVKYLTEDEHSTITSNISETGIFMRTKKKFPNGRVLDIRLEIPDAQVIPLKGEVARNTSAESRLMGTLKTGVGIRLIDPPEEYLRFVRAQLH